MKKSTMVFDAVIAVAGVPHPFSGEVYDESLLRVIASNRKDMVFDEERKALRANVSIGTELSFQSVPANADASFNVEY